jgi:hypothetical protein
MTEPGSDPVGTSVEFGGEAAAGGRDGARLMRRLRKLRTDLIAVWSRSPRRVELHRKPEMSWRCPKCQARNAAIIASDAEAGKIVDVSCLACGTKHEVSVFSRAHSSGAHMTVGVVWV